MLDKSDVKLTSIEGELDMLLSKLQQKPTHFVTRERMQIPEIEHPHSYLGSHRPPHYMPAPSKVKAWDKSYVRNEATLAEHRQWLNKFTIRNAALQRS